MLSGTPESKALTTERKRYGACRKATQYANNNPGVVHVTQLAAAGVSFLIAMH
jgi:hypothetical protein